MRLIFGTRLVRDPDGLVGRIGLGSRTWPSFFSPDYADLNIVNPPTRFCKRG